MTDPNKNQNDKTKNPSQPQRQPQKQDQGGMKDRQPQKNGGTVDDDRDDDQDLNDVREPGAEPSTQRVGNNEKPIKR